MNMLILKFLIFFGVLFTFLGSVAGSLGGSYSVAGWTAFTNTVSAGPFTGMPAIGQQFSGGNLFVASLGFSTDCVTFHMFDHVSPFADLAHYDLVPGNSLQFMDSIDQNGRVFEAGNWEFTADITVANAPLGSNTTTLHVDIFFIHAGGACDEFGGYEGNPPVTFQNNPFFQQDVVVPKNATTRVVMSEHVDGLKACDGWFCGGTNVVGARFRMVAGNQTTTIQTFGPNPPRAAYISYPSSTAESGPLESVVFYLTAFVKLIGWVLVVPFQFFIAVFGIGIGGNFGPFGWVIVLIEVIFLALIFLTVLDWLRGRNG